MLSWLTGLGVDRGLTSIVGAGGAAGLCRFSNIKSSTSRPSSKSSISGAAYKGELAGSLRAFVIASLAMSFIRSEFSSAFFFRTLTSYINIFVDICVRAHLHYYLWVWNCLSGGGSSEPSSHRQIASRWASGNHSFLFIYLFINFFIYLFIYLFIY